MRLMCGFPFAPIQILTGDTRKGCVFRCGWLLDERRSFQRKSRIERRFESLPGVQRFANLWGTFGSFRTSEKNKTVFPYRENRGSANLDSARRNGGFAQTQLNPFAALGGYFCCCRTLFCRSAASPPPCGDFFFLLFVKYKK